MGHCVYQFLYRLCQLSTPQLSLTKCPMHQERPQRNSFYKPILLIESQHKGTALLCLLLRAVVFMLWLKKSQVWNLCWRHCTIGNKGYSSAHVLYDHKPVKKQHSHSFLSPNYLLHCSGTNVYVVTWKARMRSSTDWFALGMLLFSQIGALDQFTKQL